MNHINTLKNDKKETNINTYSNLNLQVLNVQEKERERIARDLHDGALQNIAHLVHKIELASMYIDKDPIRAKLELATIEQKLRGSIDDIRSTIFDLRPMSFDDLGLKEALERFFLTIKENHNIDMESNIEPIVYDNDTVLMTIYRFVQEACNNAVKHSECKKIFVSLLYNHDEKWTISIKDDGKGFNVDEVLSSNNNHFGILIMKERIELIGGTVSFTSSSEGTEVKATVLLTT